MTTYKYDPDYAVPPGATLKEHMEYKGWTEEELARMLNWPVERLQRFWVGDHEIGTVDAVCIANATGTDYEISRIDAACILNATSIRSRFWLRLEKNYRDKLRKLAGKTK